MPMLPDSNTLGLLVPHDAEFSKIEKVRPFEPYNDLVVDFLDSWSKRLLANQESRLFPDVITFAFWIRKGHINQYRSTFLKNHVEELRLGRGIVFHIAPSNVPINFAYSLVMGLLAGNANIVRVSSKDFRQVMILSNELNSLLQEEKWFELHDFITLVRYDRIQKAWTDFFSSLVDVRIIWGGDRTIDEIRESKIPARSFDVCFADRYSFCVINADILVREENVEDIAQGFYNDTYLFDQNACTAPHLVVWLGKEENREKAKERFWKAIQKYVDKHYNLAPVTAVDKLTAFCREAMTHNWIERKQATNNMVMRLQMESLPDDITECRSVGGYFNEYDAHSLDELAPIVTRKFQTMSYYGLDKQELLDFAKVNRLVGIDRIVPIGKTLDFEPVWDGWDLVATMSRIVIYN
nr:acyl-CoA reductase [uncultured Sphaerochaeta sp.]